MSLRKLGHTGKNRSHLEQWDIVGKMDRADLHKGVTLGKLGPT